MEEQVNEILNRSVANVYPTKEVLKKELLSRKLRIYMGIDPTASYVHLGHATNYLILKRLHKLGHKIIILIGDFTAMIGDPSDKNSLRKKLSKEEVLENLKTFKDQIGKIIDFDDQNNPVEFRFNSEWLAKLDFKDSVELASNFTVQQMLERDNFEKRIRENKPLYVHEFFYPLMQGYDSVALEADLEIGGTDQTFNMLAGRILVKAYQNREKMVLTTTLLENPVTKEKLMSKSLGTGIGLLESPDSMFGKIMAMPDEAIIQVFTDCTDLPLLKIKEYESSLKEGINPKDLKIELGKEIVRMYHSENEANLAAQNFENIFSKMQFPENAEVIVCDSAEKIIDILVNNGVVESKTEFRRLIEAGAVSDYPDKKITDSNEVVGQGQRKIKIGKRIFIILNPQ